MLITICVTVNFTFHDRLLRNHTEKVAKVFSHGKCDTYHDPSAMSEWQLALICFAVAVGFGGVIAILFTEISWVKY